MIYTIIYQSKAQQDFNFKDIDLMLMKAKQKNKRLGITGCIVYANNTFIQLIQGHKKEITDLYDVIKSDKRHYDIVTLLEKPSQQELWREWSMAVLNFSGGSTQIMHSRVLLESYFETANTNEKQSEAYRVFHSNVSNLLGEVDQLMMN